MYLNMYAIQSSSVCLSRTSEIIIRDSGVQQVWPTLSNDKITCWEGLEENDCDLIEMLSRYLAESN
jgi:hypothetical protein